MLMIMFGLSGSGKNFTGELLSKEFGFYFFDADTVLPQDMQNYVAEKKSFTTEMRDRFTEIIIENISCLQKEHENLIVAQALYKEKNREQISKAYPGAKFIHVTADAKIITARLKQRNNWIDESYAKKISQNFEEPMLSHNVLINEGSQETIIKQFKEIFPSLDSSAGTIFRSKL